MDFMRARAAIIRAGFEEYANYKTASGIAVSKSRYKDITAYLESSYGAHLIVQFFKRRENHSSEMMSIEGVLEYLKEDDAKELIYDLDLFLE